jgi:hypothetical protein
MKAADIRWCIKMGRNTGRKVGRMVGRKVE